MALKDWKLANEITQSSLSKNEKKQYRVYHNIRNDDFLAIGIWDKEKSDFGVVLKNNKFGNENNITLLPHTNTMIKAITFAEDYMRRH
jgi:hypothetical protein